VAVVSTTRVFFALWPDTAAASRLHALARQLHARLGGRLMREDTLHATLAFIGDIAPERMADLRVAADAVRAPAFRLAFDVAACWRHNHIVYLGMRRIPEALHGLQSDLAARLREAGFPLEARAFSPHITLLRKAECSGMCVERENPATEPVAWSVRDFVLVKSSISANGSRYVQIGRWPLL
jgi:RNA 2',3'-cyclic 3'-phosphodiesterase